MEALMAEMRGATTLAEQVCQLAVSPEGTALTPLTD